ncbi:MAG: NAD(P)/FAD-dependent oxidoreductase [Elusimicrobia bacterium]|nr:NAD(P)/FAD-dependent oxidoreductase [Elusimicrobiota bacterium]
MEKIDITVIGAGIVGLAVAAAVARKGTAVFILEKNEAFGMETSSRNSEVIHAGIYYPGGSLRHRLCIEGNAMLYSICEKAGISCSKTGKFIVAAGEEEKEEIEFLYENGRKNGVPGLEMVTAGRVNGTEPDIRCDAAVYSPSTGIVDTHNLMKYFLHEARAGGAEPVFNTEVTGFQKDGSDHIVKVRENNGGEFDFRSGIVINCAGLESDRVSCMAGIDAEKNKYSLHYCKGSYFRLGNSQSVRIKHLVYPAVKKDSVSLGIHVTPDLGGGLRLGPDAEYISREKKDYSVAEEKKEAFFDSVKRFIPSVKKDDLHPDTSGIRPKLQGPGEGFRDFIIKEESGSGLKGFINLVGIDSPGLTAAPAIARMVKEML